MQSRHPSLSFNAAMLVCLVCLAAPRFCHAEFPTNIWTYRLPENGAVSSPAIAPDGTIYQATFSGQLIAVDPQGKAKWHFKAGREIKSSPAIADDGTIYFGSRDWKLFAITPKGKLKWFFPTGGWVDSSPAIGADGTIYFGSWDTNFYALNSDGSKKWIFPTGAIVDSSPAIGADGTIYFGSHDKRFYALRPDGTKKWEFPTGGPITSSPAIGTDGTVYFTSTDGNFYALRPDGTEHWRVNTGGWTSGSPVLDADGNLYLPVYAMDISYDSNGNKRWTWWCALPIDATPAVTAGGVVYAASPWRNICALSIKDGKMLWNVEGVMNIIGSPVIGEDGTLYVCDEVYLRAINSTTALPPLAKSPWPMFRANPRHTGRVNAN
jgi:outer membrane protein assembly factor BamB